MPGAGNDLESRLARERRLGHAIETEHLGISAADD
jgi:hypothetical protein